VVVDLVLNHTSVEHPWFRESVRSPDSPRRAWYLWSPTDLGWRQPWNQEGGSCWVPARGAFYYALFWSGMPDLDYRNPAVREEAKAIASFWLERGVDGFRLDAARHIVENGPGPDLVDTAETHAFWKEFAAHVRKVKPEAVLVGEVWTDLATVATYFGSAAPGARGDELDLLFDFDLAGSILAGVRAGDATGIASTLEAVRRAYPPGTTDAPFLSNHDQVRVSTVLDGDLRGLALAAAILLTVPGSPFLYYGEEIGMRNGEGREDPYKRTPMAWAPGPGAGFTTGEPWIDLAPGGAEASVSAQSGDPGSLLSRYRELLRARRGSAALRRGDLEILPAGPGVLAFLRRAGGEVVLVVHNLSFAEAAVGPVPAPGATSARPLFSDPAASATVSAESVAARLPARSSGAWRIDAGGVR
jgi:glycosidase